ncbi:MAG: D-alanine--D-alanine ligase [Candidatus Schekmanbacteria bacterium]|nr:D-alanine--D-alanine ligase [Candidatus Schekmanbacteria bacterium]
MKPLLQKKIGVLMGGTSSERDISLKTGSAVLTSLLRQKFNAVEIDPAGGILKKLEKEKIDIAFISLHGPGGEDGTVQGLLEIEGIPYTGSNVLASAISMDKELSKIIFLHNDIPTPNFIVARLDAGDDAEKCINMLAENEIPYPVVCKPACGGSTIGITIVKDEKEMAEAFALAGKYDGKLIIEEFIKGRDLTVGVLRGEALPVIEMSAKSGFYDFDAKYKKGMTTYICPAKISEDEEMQCRQYSLMASKALGCSGSPRVDIRMDAEGNVYVLEVNTIPGMTETSLLPMAAAKVGISFDKLVYSILEEAYEKKR